ncbi:hypothetical protein HK104_005875 [Borealophlyctis nickersoniae]|nr:hypothetical protein HK104_005875 [Borealophlyctis nickersoniae]
MFVPPLTPNYYHHLTSASLPSTTTTHRSILGGPLCSEPDKIDAKGLYMAVALVHSTSMGHGASAGIKGKEVMVMESAERKEGKKSEVRFDGLPYELRVRVFGYLNLAGLIRVGQVCRLWKQVAFDGSLWCNMNLSPYYRHVSSARLLDLAAYSGGFLKVANFRELTSINLSGLGAVTHITLEAIATHCRKLKSFNVSHCKNINSVGMRLVAHGCPDLRELQISRCTTLDDETLLHVATLSNLQHLNASYCNFTDTGFRHLASNPPRTTTHLNLTGTASSLTSETLTLIAATHPNLTTLELSGGRLLSDISLASLVATCPHLTQLDLEECTLITDATLLALAASPCAATLTTLCLSYCDNITDTGVTHLLEHCTQLAHIELDNCNRVTDAVLDYIARNRPEKLADLEVYDCRSMTCGGIRALQRSVSDDGSGRGPYHSSVVALAAEGATTTTATRRPRPMPPHPPLRVRSFYTTQDENEARGGGGRAAPRRSRHSCLIL